MYDLPTPSALSEIVGTPTRDEFDAVARKARQAIDATYSTALPERSRIERLFAEPYESPCDRLARLVAEHRDPLDELGESIERMLGGRTELERLLAGEDTGA